MISVEELKRGADVTFRFKTGYKKELKKFRTKWGQQNSEEVRFTTENEYSSNLKTSKLWNTLGTLLSIESKLKKVVYINFLD